MKIPTPTTHHQGSVEMFAFLLPRPMDYIRNRIPVVSVVVVAVVVVVEYRLVEVPPMQLTAA